MTTNPILRAVHHATSASPIERYVVPGQRVVDIAVLTPPSDLLPSIEQRDAVSVSAARLAEGLQDVRRQLANTYAERLSIGRENVQLASQVVQLADESEQSRTVSAEDPYSAREVRRLEGEVKASRQRWKLMKGTASAVVAGSGVDWAQNQELRSVVLDPE